MKMAVSERDKRMLLLLAAFFAALAYYYLIFAPLQSGSAAVAKELRDARSSLLVERAAVIQLRSWQAYCSKLKERVSSVVWMAKAPPSSQPAPERMEAIMRAAAKAGASVESLRPIMRDSSSGSQSQSQSEEVAGFALSGSSTCQGFLTMLRELCGMKLNRFSLSAGDSQGALRFYLELSSLPKTPPGLPLLPREKSNLGSYLLDQDLFSAKALPLPAQAQSFYAPPPPLSVDERLLGVRLDGTACADGVMLAIVSDPVDRDEPFGSFRERALLRGARIVSIKDGEITLSDGGALCKLEAGSSAPQLELPAPAPGSASAPLAKPARLGLHVHVLSPEYAAERGLAESSGLLVLKARDDMGVEAGDVIKAIAGAPALSIPDVERALQKFKAGDIVPVTLARHGQLLKIQVKCD